METIIILDFGSQYTQLIARRVREERVYCKILPCDAPLDEIKGAKGIILSGGPRSVYDPDSPNADPQILNLGVPVLGICYGMQWIVHTLGGEVSRASLHEYGRAELELTNPSPLFTQLPMRIQVWMSHGDEVKRLPSGFEAIGKTPASPFAAIADHERKIFGLQFHPEVAHTQRGVEIIRNFLFFGCFCGHSWTMTSFIQRAIEEIKEKVGDERVICALSGGVDSSTCAVLVHKAIGERLFCIFVNNGLLRKDEPQRVIRTFREHFRINLDYVDAEERFLERLKGVEDPEEKRRRIGDEFARIFHEEAEKIEGCRYLAQGTLYPDVIESLSQRGPSSTIKTHHNVGGMPQDMNLSLVEPFRELFKDEVRKIAKELGLPDEIVWQHPFPGPGLAVRIIGEVTKEKCELLREVDAIIEEEMKISGLYRTLWQAFGLLLPVRTVGVMGDQRTYERVVAIRAVKSEDAMTADWADLPHEVLSRISSRIVNEVRGVNRVVLDITSKPPATIEWE
jgi:GMP synthase (glutamine-hydrolysing)